ncbi:DUF4407 domain-containing protein [Mycobacterium decipiens]|uniref:DUF4407 domain-containing protein n=1 Tax=Mycobacterium decipiens TaxID=1430326 RepID=A0A1X2LSC0_9MYCO|nr:DUF4407 domain-containing protein [Mycobacterium decipiens]OSC39669.1 hypothetical protein B8W66_16040 [Mycobacterium decipiens]
MCAHEFPEQRSAVFGVEGLLTWLGGGHRRELGEHHERSTHAVAGAVVVLGAVLAGLVASLAVRESAGWPVWSVVALTLLFGLLVGAVTRGTVSGPARAWPGIAGRAAVAIAVGLVVAELAALVMFSGSIDRRLDERALRNADSAPAVAQASASLQQTRNMRTVLDSAVEQARGHLDQALVIARCEYHPTPACPQTRITGVPGRGPETRTANQLLADAQRELDNAVTARDSQAPALDAKVTHDEQTLADARKAVVANAGRGLGTRWVAMNELTVAGAAASAGALMLRILTIALFALLYLLPLILRLWRGETTHDRHAAAQAERERVELEADTAIAVKRAEVRRAAEIMWAEHQLTQTRLAIEAQAEIDREQQRRRVVEALDGPVRASSERAFEPVEEDMYLPIAAEAEAASRAVAQLPGGSTHTRPDVAANLPAQIEPGGAVDRDEKRATPVIPSIPDATKAAARWIRPLVPPFVARVIDNTTAPLRTARQVFEEVEEITFSFKRTHKVTVDAQSSDNSGQTSLDSPATAAPVERNRIDSSRAEGDSGRPHGLDTSDDQPPLGQVPRRGRADLPVGSTDHDSRPELVERDGPEELRAPDGPRELPPAK